MTSSYVQGTNDYSGNFLPHLDLNWPTTAIDVAQTALGSGKTMADLSTAMNNHYFRLLMHQSDSICFKVEHFIVSLMLTYECQLLTSKFVFRSEKYPEGNRLRLVRRGSADLFTLEEALSHCGIGNIVGQLVDDYSDGTKVAAVNQALSTAGLPIAVYCNQGYAGVVIGNSGGNGNSQ